MNKCFVDMWTWTHGFLMRVCLAGDHLLNGDLHRCNWITLTLLEYSVGLTCTVVTSIIIHWLYIQQDRCVIASLKHLFSQSKLPQCPALVLNAWDLENVSLSSLVATNTKQKVKVLRPNKKSVKCTFFIKRHLKQRLLMILLLYFNDLFLLLVFSVLERS